MCTVITLERPGHAWPFLLAANRDERLDRAWDPPAAYWPDRPGIVAGRDRTAGGTWLGVNRHGVVAAVLNRPGSLGPQPGRRSRGELPLMALTHCTAQAAVEALAGLDAGQWRSFNMVLGGPDGVWFARGAGAGHPGVVRLQPGLHMTTAHDPDSVHSPRTTRHLPRFRAATPPEPAMDSWASWESLLADDSGPATAQLHVRPHDGFGTVCASLIGVSSVGAVRWMFAAGTARFAPVDLAWSAADGGTGKALL